MLIYEIYGKGYEPSLFIISGWKGKERVYAYNKFLGVMVERTNTDMNYKQFLEHLEKMKNEGFEVHRVTKEFKSGILKN